MHGSYLAVNQSHSIPALEIFLLDHECAFSGLRKIHVLFIPSQILARLVIGHPLRIAQAHLLNALFYLVSFTLILYPFTLYPIEFIK